MAVISLDLRGMPEVRKMLAEVQGQPLQNRVRRAERAGIAVYRDGLRAAGRAHLGWPRRPKTFARTRTRSHRNPVGVSVSPQSPLSNIFEHGARPHQVNGHPHPGVGARPFIGPVFSAGESKAYKAVGDKLLEGL